MSEERAILMNIKEIIKERGLTTGSLIDRETGEVCFLGAWKIAEGIDPDWVNSSGEYEDSYQWFDEEANPVVRDTLIECANDAISRWDDDEFADWNTPGNEWYSCAQELYEINDRKFEKSPKTPLGRVNQIINCAIEKVAK